MLERTYETRTPPSPSSTHCQYRTRSAEETTNSWTLFGKYKIVEEGTEPTWVEKYQGPVSVVLRSSSSFRHDIWLKSSWFWRYSWMLRSTGTWYWYWYFSITTPCISIIDGCWRRSHCPPTVTIVCRTKQKQRKHTNTKGNERRGRRRS